MPTLMVSISGIRGIIGDGLEPEVLVKYTSAYADFCGNGKIVVGRDARISGEMVRNIVNGTLSAKGNDVIDIGICPTPTVQYTVKTLKAAGGIAISASHNPNEWNALKLLNSTGQFMTPEENLELQKILLSGKNVYPRWDKIGKITYYDEGLKKHLHDVLNLKHIDVEAIRKRKFKVLADCVNGAGVYVIPQMLRDLGCEVIEMNCEKTGIFPRLPEPLPENLTATMKAVKDSGADLGVVVDPDVDRLVLITDQGEPFGEENTITQAVRFVLSKEKGNVAVNLSTTRAVDDVASQAGCKVFRSPVGEANVVKKMKEVNAVIGGEGSGGVIYPALHFGRDALVGVAITLQHLLEFQGSISDLKKALPRYFIAKRKIELGGKDPEDIIKILVDKYSDEKINTEDGLRIDFPDHWVHFRKSNTEPIIRCVTEAKSLEEAERYIDKYFGEIKSFF
ncbi:MAG: phosphoglucosamine mutase [Ignavibacteria bacterium]|nr:phosphoglucosamine mutase [Ignavibacteria bacterium]MCU7501595.1 phosphoglucosamine mutase [Ignavibacteria bacterium]MCU7517132.1 phosphoglucosamine mutase [Ignavibacteria bacterium]